MAERRKTKSTGASRPRAATPIDVDILAVVKERDELKVELAAAMARLAELEAARKEALDRIDWAIDSLHSLVVDDA